MRNLSFKGYAQSKGFNPQQVPDETWKLEQETQRSLRGMREVRDQNRANRSDQLQALQANNAKEERQRDSNFNLLNDFKKAYHDAEMQHYEVAIQDARTGEIEARRNYAELEKLKSLVPKAFNAFVGFQNQREAEILGKSQQVVTDFYSTLGSLGVDVAEARAHANDALVNGVSVGEKLKDIYTNPVIQHEINQRFKGLRGVALHKGLIDKAYGPGGVISNKFYEDAAKIIPGQGVSYNQLKSDPEDVTGERLHGYLDIDRDKSTDRWLAAGYGNGFVADYISKKQDEFYGLQRKLVNDHVEKNLQNALIKADKENVTALLNHYKNDPMKGVMEWIGMGENMSARWGFSADVIDQLFASGELDRVDYNRMFAFKTDYNGSEKEAGIQRPNEFQRWGETLHNKETANRKLEVDRKKNIGSQAKQMYVQTALTTGERLNAATMQKIHNHMTSSGMTESDINTYAPWYKDEMNREAMPIESAKNYAKLLQRDGQFTVSAMISTMPPSLWKEFLPKTNEGMNINQEELNEAYGVLKAEIANVTDQLNLDPASRSSSVKNMFRVSKRKFFPKLLSEIAKGENVDVNDAIDRVLEKELNLIKGREGIYQIKKDANGKPLYADKSGFAYFDGLKIDQRLNNIEDTILSDPSAIEQPDFFGEDTDQIIKYSEGRSMMPISLQVAHDAAPMYSYKDITNAVRVANGLDPIEHVGLEKVETIVSPENRKSITNKPSLNKTINAVVDTAEKAGTIDTANQLITEALIPKDIYNYNEKDPYDVVRNSNGLDTSTNLFKKPASTLTFAEVKNALGSNMMTSFGAFDLTSEDLFRAEFKGEIGDDSILSPELQRRIYRSKLNDDTSKIFVDGMYQAIPGIGHENYESLKAPKAYVPDIEAMENLGIQFAGLGFNTFQLTDHAFETLNQKVTKNE